MTERKKYLLLAALVLPLLLLAACLRLLKVSDDHGSTLVWLWAWQDCRVEFVNSVTGHPVSLSFRAPWRFSGFHAITDPGTEEYYTGGEYVWNSRLAGETRQRLQYCSEVGLSLTLGPKVFRAQGGCLGISLQWPP
jgi:hypothetical protein